MESLIGQVIDNYKILSIRGKGGMGTVFKALDTNLDKIVALKMIDPNLAQDENFARRFKTEARALAKLENRNIVSVHALRETEKGTFIIMEYVEAETLSEKIRNDGVFTVEKVIDISKQLVSAISYAHKIGIIHRDIKPSNILLTDNGEIKVTDFGLAKDIQAHGRDSTVTQMKAGTLYYMSPEQVKGLKNVDKRSDIYSAGMTIYEMLAGRVPFDKTDSDFTIQKQIVDGKIPSPVVFNSNIPKQLAKIISKSISADQNKRYQNADEMLKAIEEYEKTTKKISIKKSPHSAKTIKYLITSLIFIVLLVGTLLLTNIFDKSSEIGTTKLSIKTTPSKAEVFLNDEKIGNSPIEDYSFLDDNLILTIKKSGFLSIDTSITIKKGDPTVFSFTLKAVYSDNIDNDQKELFGGLRINSEPLGATIYLNEIEIGKTPYYDYMINPGNYKLYLKLDDYSNYEENLEIVANQVIELSPTLSRKVAYTSTITNKTILTVESIPSGAEIILDGKFKGTTPNKYDDIKPGNYKLVISLKNHFPNEKMVNVREGKNTRISQKLIGFGFLNLTTKPVGAEIVLNGKSIGKTPKRKKVESGKYTLELRKEGFEISSSKVTLIKGEVKDITQILNPLFGEINIIARPFGTVYINGELKGEEKSNKPFKFNLPIGFYDITVLHHSFGKWIKRIKVESNNPKDYNINFNQKHTIRILSEPKYCEIIVDGESTNKFTPKELQLNTGWHTIKVKKDGYKLVGREYSANIETDIKEPVLFQLKKK